MAQSTTVSGAKVASGTKKIELTTPAKSQEAFSGIKWLDNFVGDYKFNRYGIYVIALLLIGILAGVAVGLGAMNSPWQIALLIVPTMAALVMILGIAPMRLLLWTVLIACLIDILMIVYQLVTWNAHLDSLF